VSGRKCEQCGSGNLVDDVENGETICGRCATVTTYNPETNDMVDIATSSVGAPTTLRLHDMGLSTSIDKKNVDASGKVIQDRGTLKRMRIWDGRTQVKTPSDRNLKFALTELNRLTDKLSIPEATADKAAYYYRKTLEKKLTRGRAISVIIAACLYAACRTEMIPRNLNDIYRAANLKKKDIATCYRLVVNELEIQMPLVDPTHIVSRITSKIDVGQRSERIAIKFLEEAKAVGETAGKDPMGIASAAVYLACILTNSSVTQRQIADAAEVTEVTIRNRLSKLKTKVDWKQYLQ
tara:strand:+ start:1174 stop:2055 length:882 start_codon:yes stop_codon:yes gene_type:complete